MIEILLAGCLSGRRGYRDERPQVRLRELVRQTEIRDVHEALSTLEVRCLP